MRPVALRSAPDTGPVRVEFRYNKTYSTSADFCEKSRRQQFCEEAHEQTWRRWAIVNPHCVDVQFQPVEAIFEDAAGNQTRIIWDIGIELSDGSIAFGEIKANPSFFLEPRAATRAEASAKALSAYGIPFLRLHGTDFDAIGKETIKQVFDFRRTTFDQQADLAPLLDEIISAGGQIAMRRAIKFIGGPDAAAQAKLCAMMVRRHIAIDLTRPLMGGSTVCLAPEAVSPGSLRRFLASLTPIEGDRR